MLKDVLTMLTFRKRRVLSAPDRARNQALCGVPCHQSRAIVFPDIRSPHCSDSLEPSFTVLPLYVRRKQIVCSLLQNDSRVIRQNTLHPRVPSGTQTYNLPTKQRAPRLKKNGQARRRPVDPAGSNAIFCPDFV